MKRTMTRLVLIFAVFLMIVLSFFLWIFRYSTDNIRQNVIHATTRQLEHAEYLLDSEIKEAELNALSVLSDRLTINFDDQFAAEKGSYQYLMAFQEMRGMLGNQMKNSEGIESITIYWPESKEVISSYETIFDAVEFYEALPDNGWIADNDRMFYVTSYPYNYLLKDSERSPAFRVVVELSRYHLDEIRQLISNTDNSRSLLLLPDGSSITDPNRTDRGILSSPGVKQSKIGNVVNTNIKYDGEEYMTFFQKSEKSGIQLITYLPLSKLMYPISRITTITIIGCFLFLVLALMLVRLFRENVASQVQRLVDNFKRVENGDFTTRIVDVSNNEFGYLAEQFNQMVAGGQRLLTSLANEQKSRDLAEMKQLQFQINPHFLYNSLAYIVSVAHNQEAVTNMSVHLADYYRYRTKTLQDSTLAAELKFAENYLVIMAMRKELDFTITVPEDLGEQPILPLLIQPLIENGIEHGIEGKEGAHRIRLEVIPLEDMIQIAVSDDGYGLSQPEINELLQALAMKQRPEKISVGLWNVNQRLVNRYGQRSSLNFKRNEMSGLTVYFNLPK